MASPKLLEKVAAESRERPERQSDTPNTVVFTSFDGTVREVVDLPLNLGRATALASERTLSKIWGSEEEAKDCQNMFEEI